MNTTTLAHREALRIQARQAYEANPQLFGDEHDVLRALVEVPADELPHHLELLALAA